MNIDKLTLHHFPASRSARAKWILHETVGDDFDTKIVDLYGGEQFAANYLVLNPNHNVPTLEILWKNGEKTTMLESAAMVAFLADAFPEKNLAPKPDALSPARADYLHMLHFAGSWMDMMLWQIRIHEHVLPENDKDPRTALRYRKKFVDEIEPQLKARLEKTEFICGDEFTAADCIVGHNVTWARGYDMCEDPVFRGYLSRISKRRPFVKAFADARKFTLAPPDGMPETKNVIG